MRRVIWLLAMGLAFAALAGCAEDVDSDDVATDAIYANIWVEASGDGNSRAYTALRVGGSSSNTFLELTDYDALMTFVNDTSKGMAESESALGTTYSATFPYEAEDTPFRVAFLRTPPPDGECAGKSAPNSTVTLPRPFSITAPAPSTSVSRGAGFTFTWNNSGESDPLSYRVSGTCIQDYSESISSDSGSYTIPAGSIMVVGTDQTVSCAATLTLSRTRAGSLDPNYGEGGVISARQYRTLDFETTQ